MRRRGPGPFRVLRLLVLPAVLLLSGVFPGLARGGAPAAVEEGADAAPVVPVEPSASGLAVEGSDYAYLRVVDPDGRLTSYRNAGYRLEVRGAEDGGREVVVEVSLAPLGSEDPFPVAAAGAGTEGGSPKPPPATAGGSPGAAAPPIPEGGVPNGKDGKTPDGRTLNRRSPGSDTADSGTADSDTLNRTSLERKIPAPASAPPAGHGEGELVRLAREVTAGATSRYEAVSAVLGWIVHHVVSEETAALAALPRRPLGSAATPPAGEEGAGNAAPPSTGSSRAGETRGTGEAGAAAAAGTGRATAPPSPRPGEPRRAGGAETTTPPSGLLAVVRRGSGSADEVARLAVALLRAVGIEARTVRGQVVGVPEIGSPWGPHTWIEVHYPDVGWVFSDPWVHHHYVPATYVRFPPAGAGDAVAEEGRRAGVVESGAGSRSGAAGQVAPQRSASTGNAAAATGGKDGAAAGGSAAATAEAEGTVAPGVVPELRLIERRDRRETVDLYPAGSPGVTARKNGPAQRAGVLRVVVSGAGRGSAVLEGEDGRRSKMLVAGESTFVGLQGGAYRLEVYLEGRPPIVRQVRVGPRERRAVFLRDPQQATRWDPGAAGPRSAPSPPGERRGGRPDPRRPDPR